MSKFVRLDMLFEVTTDSVLPTDTNFNEELTLPHLRELTLDDAVEYLDQELWSSVFSDHSLGACVRACMSVRACVRACVRVSVCACVRAWCCTCLLVCMHACVHTWMFNCRFPLLQWWLCGWWWTAYLSSSVCLTNPQYFPLSNFSSAPSFTLLVGVPCQHHHCRDRRTHP